MHTSDRMDMICNKCDQEKDVSQFYKDTGKKSGYRQPCKKCAPSRNSYHKKWRELNAEKAREYSKKSKSRPESKLRERERAIERNYNMTVNQYNDLIAEQNGLCAICKRPPVMNKGKGFAIDHDHSCCPERGRSCGKCIRGLLCVTCNQALGMFQDSEQVLLNAIKYLNARSALGAEGAAMHSHFG